MKFFLLGFVAAGWLTCVFTALRGVVAHKRSNETDIQ